jgi:Transcriptional regulator, AbiEi antitoxin/Protein of unknown function (DUF559)
VVALGSPYDPSERPRALDARLAAFVEDLHGVVGIDELRALGFSKTAIRRRVESGRLHRVHLGVYAVGHRALSPDGVRRAAVLACGPAAVLSHRAAAAVWKLLDNDMLREVTTPGRRVGPCDVVLHRTRRLEAEDVTAVRGIPITTVPRTIVDVAEVVRMRALQRAVHEAEVLDLLDVRATEDALYRVPGRRARRRVLGALGVKAPDPTNSDFTAAFLRLCERFRLPRPSTGVYLDTGEWLAEIDCLFPREKVIAELDGERIHLTRQRFHSDRRRDAALAARGWLTLRFTWERVTKDAERVAHEVRRVLESRRS